MCGGSISKTLRRASSDLRDFERDTRYSLQDTAQSGYDSYREDADRVGRSVFHNDWLARALEKRGQFTYESGGDKITDPLGLFAEPRDRYISHVSEIADARAKAVEASLKPNAAPEAPEEVASVVNPAEDIRNKRRKAILMGSSQLRSPGPGIASGGGYAGANTQLG